MRKKTQTLPSPQLPSLYILICGTDEGTLCRAHTSTANDAAATTFAFVQAVTETASSLDSVMAYTPCNSFALFCLLRYDASDSREIFFVTTWSWQRGRYLVLRMGWLRRAGDWARYVC